MSDSRIAGCSTRGTGTSPPRCRSIAATCFLCGVAGDTSKIMSSPRSRGAARRVARACLLQRHVHHQHAVRAVRMRGSRERAAVVAQHRVGVAHQHHRRARVRGAKLRDHAQRAVHADAVGQGAPVRAFAGRRQALPRFSMWRDARQRWRGCRRASSRRRSASGPSPRSGSGRLRAVERWSPSRRQVRRSLAGRVFRRPPAAFLLAAGVTIFLAFL